MEPQFLIVDGHSYIFRAFYGIKASLTNREGLPTNAVFGFKNMLAQILRDLAPTHIAVVFDRPGPNFRHAIYPEYKANRSEAPDDLKVQFEPIFRLVEALKLPTLQIDEYEADDVIGTLVRKFSGESKVTIVSGDKDLTQLVSDTVHMFDSLNDKLYKPEDVEGKFGVKPELMAQFLALMGDTSDNIPGAAGIGCKTAKKLLDEFGSIEAIYRGIDRLAGKQRQNLEKSKQNVELSLQLTKIACDVPIGHALDDFAVSLPDLEKLKSFYAEMNFRYDELIEGHPDAVPADRQEKRKSESGGIRYDSYELVTSEARLREIRQAILAQNKVCLDLETTSLAALEARIVGIAMAWQGGDPIYVPVMHNEPTDQIPLPVVLDILAPIFRQENLTIVGQNIKYELMVLANYGIRIRAKIEDTMLQSYLLEADRPRHSLDWLALRHLNHRMIKYEEVAGKGKKQIPFSEVPVSEALRYAAEDADATLRIHEMLHPKLRPEELMPLYNDIELPLCRTLAAMERHGVKVNVDRLRKLRDQLSEELKTLEQSIHFLTGEEFNINSTRQLGAVLFEKMGITAGKKKTKTGYSTDIGVLEKIAEEHPIGAHLIEYRTKTKLVNTYLDVLPTLVNENTGRIHTSYSQTTAATGRLSSKNPNLQNIPIRRTDGRRIREAFVAEPGFSVVSADYSQIELRFLAHLSEDENLLRVYHTGGDIHTETAAAIFGTDPSQVSDEERRSAKAINFGIIYGMGAYRLAKEIGVSNRQAKDFIESYFAKYPKIRAYMRDTIAQCRKMGYVKTIFNRKRPLPDINSSNNMVKSAAERAAINTRIQGSAADLIKIAMIDIDRNMERFPAETKMIMQVHDELVFEIENDRIGETMAQIKEIMENCISLKVPLLVDIRSGENWQEAH